MMNMFNHPIRLTLLLLAMAALTAAAGCSASRSTEITLEDGLMMAGRGMLSDQITAAPSIVQDAYRFAIANPETLEGLPCYCGCGSVGHTSNYSCYVEDDSDPENLTFDRHALGCGICVDITVDAMRMTREGKGLPEIRAFIDQTYGAFGPSNIP